MSEPKTQCTTCNATILVRTAERNKGLCAPCRLKADAIPPPGFEIPHDIAERAHILNEDPARIPEMVWRYGADCVRRQIDELEASHALYREWSPQLRALAANRCEEQRLPVDEALSARDRAKQQLYTEKLTRESPAPGREMSVAICAMPLLAIPVAQSLWAPLNDQTVILTPEEKARWDSTYTHPENADRWYTIHWWQILEVPERVLPKLTRTSIGDWNRATVPAGEHPWVVEEGHVYGPPIGHGYTELWSWDGRQARFIDTLSNWIS